MPELIKPVVEAEPRYVKKQMSYRAIYWDGSPEAGAKIIRYLGEFNAKVEMDAGMYLDLSVKSQDVWNRVPTGSWFILSSFSPKNMGWDYEVLSNEEFKKQYEQIKEQ